MERSGIRPKGAVFAPDLASVAQKEGPFVTVVLTTEAGIENAAQRSMQHWKDARRALGSEEVFEQVLDEIEAIVPDAHLNGNALGVIANRGGVLHVEHGAQPAAGDSAVCDHIPVLWPFIGWRQASPTHMTVRADRTGADIAVYGHEQEPVNASAGGDDFPITKVKPGGWSQPRYQHQAENTWLHNAKDVVQELTDLFHRFEPELVVAAGDVRAIELIRQDLPKEVLDRTVVVEGSRADDGSDSLFQQRVAEQLAATVGKAEQEILEKFDEERGEDDRASDGVHATLAALLRGQVDILLLRPRLDDERTAFYGAEPALVADNPGDLDALGTTDVRRGPLIDVAIRAALSTSAGIRLISEHSEKVPEDALPTGGVGAILRWS
ncbi:MAG TPA: Vms1/Ankzf1 family peptidyl-tRNA hydrolase [Acidimicrobiales bacterium]|jgi:predicted phosphodiesterase|nr:Vms1/Ankzf1 family peptidyl-tRNA hydrolase [Acidimicrobiales bacterium]